jgi:hypothetical protein
MKRLLLSLLMLLLPSAVMADWVANRGGESVRLTERPCTNAAVLKLIDPGNRKHFMAGSAVVDGKPFAACWLQAPYGALVVYEDGDMGVVPQGDLKRPAVL